MSDGSLNTDKLIFAFILGSVQVETLHCLLYGCGTVGQRGQRGQLKGWALKGGRRLDKWDETNLEDAVRGWDAATGTRVGAGSPLPGVSQHHLHPSEG